MVGGVASQPPHRDGEPSLPEPRLPAGDPPAGRGHARLPLRRRYRVAAAAAGQSALAPPPVRWLLTCRLRVHRRRPGGQQLLCGAAVSQPVHLRGLGGPLQQQAPAGAAKGAATQRDRAVSDATGLRGQGSHDRPWIGYSFKNCSQLCNESKRDTWQ